MSKRDPFRHSVLASAAAGRLAVCIVILGVLWLAIAWAAYLP